MLSEFDSIKYLAKNPEAVELAIWYHDIENYPWCKDNEKRSVQILLGLKDRAGIADKVLDYAKNLIMITEYVQEPITVDEQLIVDCDIASFGKSSIEFEISNSNIRKEYSFVDLSRYTKGRQDILKRFFDKKRIYYTDEMHDKYEIQARKNIETVLRQYDNLSSVKD
jgi:predicted metal-dependent HD superfamily phosphohydrolase